MGQGKTTFKAIEKYRYGLWKTVSKHLNDPLYIDVLGITKDFLQPHQNYNKMYGTEPRFNEILVIMNTFQKRKREIYVDITNKCEHVTER